LLPNHSTWWDGFFVHLVNKTVFNRHLYLMMLEEQLRKNSFFSRVGAFSIQPDSPAAIRTTLRYTLNTLRETPSAMICWFPQGVLLPWDIRPLNYQPGISRVLKLAPKPLTVLGLAIKIEYLDDQHPDVFLQFDRPRVIDNSHDLTAERLERNETELLEELRSRICHKERGHLLLQGKSSINTVMERLKSPFRSSGRTDIGPSH
jgi:1-acyl-sn-glycerol-3-phosphate acyltransferase